MHRTMWEYDADSRSDGGVKCRSAHSALLIAFAWARRILSSQGCFARYCQLERPGSLSTQGAATPLSPWEEAEAKGNPFRKSSLVQVVSVGKKKIGQLCKSTFAYGAALPLIPEHVCALTRLPPQPESLSGPVLNPICSVHQRHPPQLSKTGFPCPSPGDGWGGRSSPHSPEFTHRISHAGTSKSWWGTVPKSLILRISFVAFIARALMLA